MLIVSHIIVAIISPLIKKNYEYTIHKRLMDGSHYMTVQCVYMHNSTIRFNRVSHFKPYIMQHTS